jgi:SAM-dependent methyltransferase
VRVSWQDAAASLVDPVDRSPLVWEPGSRTLRSASGREFHLIDGQPVLLPTEGLEAGGWVFPPIEVVDTGRPKPIRRARRLVKAYQRILRRGVGGQGAGAHFLELVRGLDRGRAPRVLIVGGATVGDGCDIVVDAPDVEVLAFDVYPTYETAFVADAHRIPLADDSVDGVWVQAVLEHVYLPHVVVGEIARVLRTGGYVYAETPFLQPVHEGAYDFCRFSASGHRLLFPQFDEVVSGPLGGPGALLALALRGLLGGFARSPRAARIAFGIAQPVAIVDRLIPLSWRADYATGSYFVGRLDQGLSQPFEAIEIYCGAG